MIPNVAAWWAPKEGNSPDEYEDSWCVNQLYASEEYAEDVMRIAVCDGTTEGYLSGRWANTIAAKLADAPLPAFHNAEQFAATVRSAAEAWAGELDAYVSYCESNRGPLMWYERHGLARGAASTLLALSVSWQRAEMARAMADNPAASLGHWYAAAIGDTCLLHVRGDRLHNAFPVAHHADFNYSPELLASKNLARQDVTAEVQFAEGDIIPGDSLYVCTDALAEWLLRHYESDDQLSGVVNEFAGDAAGFDAWLTMARKDGDLSNDDITLIWVGFGGAQ